MAQELASTFTAQDLRIYAVWMPILSHDTRDRVDPALMPDSRATRYWDQGSLSGRYFRGRPEFETYWDSIVWDAYALYDRGARWPDLASGPSGIVTRGWTIIEASEPLRFSLLTLLARPWRRVLLPIAAGRR